MNMASLRADAGTSLATDPASRRSGGQGPLRVSAASASREFDDFLGPAPAPDVEISFAVGSSIRDVVGLRNVRGSFDTLVQEITSTSDLSVKDGPYIAGPFRDGRRNKAHAEPRAWVALDLDKVGDAVDMERILEAAEMWRGVGHTTYSHDPASGVFRLRLIFATSRKVTPDEHSRLCSAIEARLAERAGVPVRRDPACDMIEQPIYTVRAGAQVWRFDGIAVRVDDLLHVAPVGTAPQLGEVPAQRTDWLAELLTGEDVHANACRIVGKWVCNGMDDGTIRTAMGVLAEKIAEVRGPDRARELVGAELERMISGARRKGFGVQAKGDGPPPEYARLDNLDSDPPPPRQWVIAKWLPRRSVTAMFGGGGIGKSLLVQQMATQVANGIECFGQQVTPGPVLAYLCEDDNDELRRRQRDILAQLGRSPGNSWDGLHLQGRAGLDNVMMSFGPDRLALYCPFLREVEHECERIRPVLLILDNVAQLFGGIENDRHEVTVFTNVLTGIARRVDCAVLVLGHVAKAQGSEFSGSTAWEAAVRTRLWMERRGDGLIELHRRKANYAELDSILLEYRDGALAVVDRTAPHPADSLLMGHAERAVLAALDTLTKRQVATSQAPTATTYLPRLAAKEGLLNGTTPVMARRALASLIDRGEILVGQSLGWKKSDRHPAVGLARKPE